MRRRIHGLVGRLAVAGGAVLASLAPTAASAQALGGDSTAARPTPIDPETAPRPTAYAWRTTARITIDGHLEEPAWRDAVAITDFVQSQPDEGYPPTEPTVVRILYDDRRLYVSAVCYDSEPDKLVVTSLERDFPGMSTRDMDIFSITLDTFLDRRNSFIFLINPRGAWRDGQTFNDSREVDFGWRAVMELETAVHDSGWTVEMAIPWTTLRFDPARGEQTWGLNVLRRVRRKSEDSYWAPVDRRDPVHRMSRAGTLEGLAGLRPGRNLRIKPFTLAGYETGRQHPDTGMAADAGVDVKYGVTSGLTLDLTYRTDFSQVDVDQEQVNLTRFPLFFPELRDFFVENSGSFVLGDVTERNSRMGSSLRDFTLFHSRRIGLSPDRRPIPIVGGARLTGRAAGFELGVLDIQTRAADSLAAENVGVVRLRRNLGASDVGVMLVNREATGGLDTGAYNRSYAADANIALFSHLIVNTYVAQTEERGASGDRTAARLSVAWRDRLWDASGFVKHVGDGFNPGVGFVRRTGIRHGYLTVGAHPRLGSGAVQELNPYAEWHHVTDLDGRALTGRRTLGFEVLFLDGGQLSLEAQNRFERLDDPFRLDTLVVSVGDYDFNEAGVSYSSNPARPLSGRVSVSGGGFFDGSRVTLGAEALWRLSYRLSVEGSVQRNRVALPAGVITPTVVGGRIRLATSTRLFASAIVQYNGGSDELVTNLRLSFIHAPLSDLFLVYTERRDLASNAVLDRVVTAKVTRLFAF